MLCTKNQIIYREAPRLTFQSVSVLLLLILKNILLVGDGYGRRNFFLLKKVVPFLQIQPKIIPFGAAIPLHILRSHPERENVDLERILPALEGRVGQCEDFFDLFVGHGVASDGNAISMDHQVVAGPVAGPVQGVRKIQPKGQMEFAVGVHLVRMDGVKALGALAIPQPLFGAQAPGEITDLVDLEKAEGVLPFDPQLQFVGLFEYP